MDSVNTKQLAVVPALRGRFFKLLPDIFETSDTTYAQKYRSMDGVLRTLLRIR